MGWDGVARAFGRHMSTKTTGTEPPKPVELSRLGLTTQCCCFCSCNISYESKTTEMFESVV